MSAETKFNKVIEELKRQINNSVKDSVESIYSDMLPYINDDTENNAIYRSHNIVSNILSGNFTVEGDEIICDGWNTKLTSNDHDRLVNKLAIKCADLAAQKKIERLERQLKESYERSY